MQFVAVFKDKNFKEQSRQIAAENHILFYHQNSAGIWWSRKELNCNLTNEPL